MRRRHRHRPYYAEQSTYVRRQSFRLPIRYIVIAALIILVGYYVFTRISYFTSTIQRSPVTLDTENRGTVRVSIEGGEWKRADNGLRLYPGDRVQTSGNSFAHLSFFDGTHIRLGEQSNMRIVESYISDRQSQISLLLDEGTAWMQSPDKLTYTGSISRFVSTNALQMELPGQTEAVLKQRILTVFDSAGIGSSVNVTAAEGTVIVGEGQSFILPEEGTLLSGDLYDYRTALDPRAIASPFVEESRSLYADARESDTTASIDDLLEPDGIEDTLTITNPIDEDILATSTVEVAGTVGSTVEGVRINGYAAQFDASENTYSLEIALPDRDQVAIVVEALDSNGNVLEELRRTVYRDREPPKPPTFISPAKTGETYQTQQERIEIIGEAPPGTVGIIVNDYRLQFFQPGDTTWKYLAVTDLDNLQYGENVFEAVAINKAGLKSEPAYATIIVGGDTEGVIESADAEGVEGGSTEEATEPDPDTLPDNAPITPGTLVVTAPSPGTAHTATGDELLIEGTAPRGSETIWVNDYRLRLFDPAKGLWNYIASTKLNTMKRGDNVYVITARNDQGEILDRIEYTITFNP